MNYRELLELYKAGELEDVYKRQVLGLPLTVNHKLYNCAVFVQGGKILGVVPKHYLPNYSEFYEARHFAPGEEEVKIDVYKRQCRNRNGS